MQDKAKSYQMVNFCTKSFLSSNQKTIYHAVLCLFNHLMCYEAETKKELQQDLEKALKIIDSILSDKDIIDQELLQAVLLCECRILYQNPEMCRWVEETFKLFFLETHQDLKKRTCHQLVKDSVDDTLSLVDLEVKKPQ